MALQKEKLFDINHKENLMTDKIEKKYPKFWEVIGHLTEAEKKLLIDANACSAACKQLIEETVRHYEGNWIIQQEVFKQVAKRLDIDIDKADYTCDWRTGEVKVISASEEAFQKIMSQLSSNQAIREMVLDRLIKDS